MSAAEKTSTVPKELSDGDVKEILYQLNRKETGDPWTEARVRDLYRTFLFVVARYPKPAPKELSDPITLRLPVDVLADVERIAAGAERSRSWVMVRALRHYLATGSEGGDCLAILRGREEIAANGGHDFDDVMAELQAIVDGTQEDFVHAKTQVGLDQVDRGEFSERSVYDIAESVLSEPTTPSRHIVKVGLAAIEDGRLLLVRKRGSEIHILPGGKPESDEDDIAALRREIEEELGCALAPMPAFLGEFTDQVAGEVSTTVTVRLYAGALEGEPRPRSEIESLHWFSPDDADGTRLAPSLENQIVPFLSDRLA